MASHLHSIYDTDLHFIVDPISRKVESESGKVSLMQNDHNSERFTFELPRYIEGHDMSLTDEVQIHYINIDGSKKTNQNADIYVVDDLQISPDSEDVVICSWLISSNATMYAGSLNFIMRFVCHDDVDIEYQWFSDVHSGIKILKGIYNTDVVTNDDDTDILKAWKKEIITHVENSDIYQAMENTVEEARSTLVEAKNTLSEANKILTDTEFSVNFDTGELEYQSTNFDFTVNRETGNLEWEVK